MLGLRNCVLLVCARALLMSMPAVCLPQHILDSLGKPLLATSVHVGEHLDEHTEVPDTGGGPAGSSACGSAGGEQ